MKLRVTATAFLVAAASIYAPSAGANQRPVIESFTFTPNDIDLLAADTKVNIELIVSHPSGIENTSTMATLTSSRNDTLATYLTRIDSPVNLALTKVTYRGVLTVPRDITLGLYNFSVGSVKNNSSAGYQYEPGAIDPKKIRNIVGAEFGLLVRSGGYLNLSYDTFVGPTYDTTLVVTYNDPIKFSSSNAPIWKVGESFVPSKYYELRVPTLSLTVTSSTPTVCSSDGMALKLLKEGLCAFIVSTPKTADYQAKSSNQTVTITAARIKPELTVEKIANQTAKDLPKSVEIFRVYSAAEGYVLPQSATPTVCFGSGFYVRIVSGGTCTLTYSTKETATFLASDLYKVSFEVTREAQTISFTPPAAANLSAKSLTLSATASSAGVIIFETTSTGICSIIGATLNLLKSGNCSITATQSGTSTLAPISATSTVMITGSLAPVNKTITCVMGKKSKKVSGANPKCPKGYKIKK